MFSRLSLAVPRPVVGNVDHLRRIAKSLDFDASEMHVRLQCFAVDDRASVVEVRFVVLVSLWAKGSEMSELIGAAIFSTNFETRAALYLASVLPP